MKRNGAGKEIERQFVYFERNYPQFDPAGTGVLLELFRTGFRCRTFLGKRLKTYGLTGQAFTVLLALETLPERRLPMNDIGRRLGVTRANVTGLVDNLEAKKLVARRRSSNDRRVTHVALTPTGRNRLKTILPGHFRVTANLFKDFTATEKDAMAALLEKLSQALA